jgi:hypothetical protein
MTTAAGPTAARRRVDEYAKHAPAGAEVKITEEVSAGYLHIAQLTVRGTIDTICVTVSWRGSGRTRANAARWYNSGGGKTHEIKVRWITYDIRHLFVR